MSAGCLQTLFCGRSSKSDENHDSGMGVGTPDLPPEKFKDNTAVAEAIPWDCRFEDGLAYVEKFGFVLDVLVETCAHIPPPFSVAVILFTVLQHQIEAAKDSITEFRELCQDITKFQREASDPLTGYYVKLDKLQKLCEIPANGSSQVNSDNQHVIYQSLVELCKQLNGTLKELVGDCNSIKASGNYVSLKGKAAKTRAKLSSFKSELEKNLNDTDFILQLDERLRALNLHNHTAANSIRCKAFRDLWQREWAAEVKTEKFLNHFTNLMPSDNVMVIANFKSLINSKWPVDISCANVNELTSSLSESVVSDETMSLTSVVSKILQRMVSSEPHKMIQNVPLQELWRDNEFGDAVDTVTLERALFIALSNSSPTAGQTIDVSAVIQCILQKYPLSKNQVTNIMLCSLSSKCASCVTLEETLSCVLFYNSSKPNYAELWNQTGDKLKVIWTKSSVPSGSNVPAAEVLDFFPGARISKLVEPAGTALFLTVCKDNGDNETCDVLYNSHLITGETRLILDQKTGINTWQTESLSFLTRFSAVREDNGSNNTGSSVLSPTAFESRGEPSVKPTHIKINNRSDIPLVAIWTKGSVSVGDSDINAVINDVQPRDCPSFDFENDMFLTLVRLTKNRNKYQIIRENNKLKLGDVVELNFEIVTNPACQVVDLNYMDKYSKTKRVQEEQKEGVAPPASTTGPSEVAVGGALDKQQQPQQEQPQQPPVVGKATNKSDAVVSRSWKEKPQKAQSATVIAAQKATSPSAAGAKEPFVKKKQMGAAVPAVVGPTTAAAASVGMKLPVKEASVAASAHTVTCHVNPFAAQKGDDVTPSATTSVSNHSNRSNSSSNPFAVKTTEHQLQDPISTELRESAECQHASSIAVTAVVGGDVLLPEESDDHQQQLKKPAAELERQDSSGPFSSTVGTSELKDDSGSLVGKPVSVASEASAVDDDNDWPPSVSPMKLQTVSKVPVTAAVSSANDDDVGGAPVVVQDGSNKLHYVAPASVSAAPAVSAPVSSTVSSSKRATEPDHHSVFTQDQQTTASKVSPAPAGFNKSRSSPDTLKCEPIKTETAFPAARAAPPAPVSPFSSAFITPTKKKPQPPLGLNTKDLKAWYTENLDYRCPHCDKIFIYKKSDGKRHIYKKNGEPSVYMINCTCYPGLKGTGKSTSVKEDDEDDEDDEEENDDDNRKCSADDSTDRLTVIMISPPVASVGHTPPRLSSASFTTPPVRQQQQQQTPPPGLGTVERKAWYTKYAEYKCPHCKKEYKKKDSGERYTFNENGSPSKYMIKCKCW